MNIQWVGIVILCLLISVVVGCVPADSTENSEGKVLLAKVHNKALYLDEIKDMIPKSSTPADSSLIVNACTDRWVKENLMLYEAERNIPKDLNIDKLVRDYRASLIIHNYEKQVAEQELDSIITTQEYEEYYEKFKSHFLLEKPLKRCKFAKVYKDAPFIKASSKWWGSKDEAKQRQMVKYCKEHATIYQLNDSIWMSTHELEEELPKTITSKMQKGKVIDQIVDDYRYFVEVMDVMPSGNIPPLSYIKKHASSYILHNRKQELVQRKKEELFQTAEKRGLVEYFTD